MTFDQQCKARNCAEKLVKQGLVDVDELADFFYDEMLEYFEEEAQVEYENSIDGYVDEYDMATYGFCQADFV